MPDYLSNPDDRLRRPVLNTSLAFKYQSQNAIEELFMIGHTDFQVTPMSFKLVEDILRLTVPLLIYSEWYLGTAGSLNNSINYWP